MTPITKASARRAAARTRTCRSALLASLPLLAPALLVLPAPALAQGETDPLTDIVTVTAQRTQRDTTDMLDAEALPPATGPDTAAMVARLPGAADIGNGALSGQVQYRGLAGERVNIRVNGQSIASGGPNLMDPPLHYAPLPLVERIEVDRGVSPVRNGPGLAGGVNAVLKSVGFGDGPAVDTHYDLVLSGRTADDSIAAGGVAGMASDTLRLQVLGAYEDGGDVETPAGRIAGSGHNRHVAGFGAGWRSGAHTFSLDWRRSETGETGNPPFAMDIRFVDTDLAMLRYDGDFEGFDLTFKAGWSDVAHAMNNYDLRPAPAMPMAYRETFAYAESVTFSGELGLDLLGGRARFGLDRADTDHDVIITNPNNPDFFITSLPSVEESRTGAFAEWTGLLGNGWEGELGLRADRYETDAGPARLGSAVPAMPGMLAMAFNMADHSRDDTTLDAVARLWRPLDDTTTLRVTLARKTRAPNYVERHAWLPTAASGGLADGNTYVGDPDLDPETAWIIEAGLDWSGHSVWLRPTVYYRRIDDYIQGVPYDDTPGVADTPVEMVSGMNGDPTPLRFANTDAELMGLDMDFGWQLDAHWQISGVVSLVDGERRDISDNLYRIAPARLTLAASWQDGPWSATLETIAVADQDDVSVTNSEAPTDGHVRVNLYGSWDVTPSISVGAGIENLFDETWRDHLAGYNRNSGSDIGLGERLPGAGRSFGVRVALRG